MYTSILKIGLCLGVALCPLVAAWGQPDAAATGAHAFLPLWGDTMPNRRGVTVVDTIVRERIVQVGTPALHLFEPSRAERTGTAVIVIPGGGYVKLAHEISGFALAKWLNTMGVTAFVLQHRFPTSPDVAVSYQAPLQDAQRAVRYVRAHAAAYGIDTSRVGVMGSSAGGHLAASLCALTVDWGVGHDSLDDYSCRPDFALLVSPVISMADSIVHRGSRRALLGDGVDDAALRRLFSADEQVSSQTPPAFIVHASDDPAVSPLNGVAYYQALVRAGVKRSSLHVFPFGRHSISLRRQPGSTALWPQLAEAWMVETGFLVPLTYENH